MDLSGGPEVGVHRVRRGAVRRELHAMRLIDPEAANELLDWARALARDRRRIIFFCSCGAPTAGCHRHLVARELFRLAKARGFEKPTVVEWPGFESEPRATPELGLSAKQIQAVGSGDHGYIPLGTAFPDVRWLRIPWYSIVRFRSPAVSAYMFTGPAQFRAGGWVLEFLGGEKDLSRAKKTSERARKDLVVPPRG